MTTLSNLQVVAELGWTMQIIHDSTGGRLPRFWRSVGIQSLKGESVVSRPHVYRPPYGDVDNRVRAIASQVFGLTTVLWNYDSNDWHLQPTNPTYTPSSVHNSLVEWISGPKSPGLIILEHELSNDSVQAFIDVYPLAKSSGWDTRTIPDLLGDSWYLNAENSTTEDITSMDVAMGGVNSLPSSIAPSIPSAGTASFSLLSPPTPGSKATSSSLMSRPFGSVLVIVVALVPLLTLLDVFHSVHV
jgi:chitin deacetylase